jgi:hypothetical protein
MIRRLTTADEASRQKFELAAAYNYISLLKRHFALRPRKMTLPSPLPRLFTKQKSDISFKTKEPVHFLLIKD